MMPSFPFLRLSNGNSYKLLHLVLLFRLFSSFLSQRTSWMDFIARCNILPCRCSVRSTLLRSGAGASWGLICKIRVKVLIHSSMSCSLSAASTKYVVTSFIFSSKACFLRRLFCKEWRKIFNHPGHVEFKKVQDKKKTKTTWRYL